MALLTSYGTTNKVIDTDLLVSYSVRYIGDHTWNLARYATLSYRYVGMTRSAANACAAALVSLYTRSIKVSQMVEGVYVTQPGGSVLMADIAVTHEEDDAWEVSVNVREEDNRMSLYAFAASGGAASYFTTENARIYHLEDTTS